MKVDMLFESCRRSSGFRLFILVYAVSLTLEQCCVLVVAYDFYAREMPNSCIAILCMCLVPSIVTQVMSYHQNAEVTQHTRRLQQGTRRRFIRIAVHLLQIALHWRYASLASSRRLPITKRELWQVFTIRALYTFSSTLPMLMFLLYNMLSVVAFGEHLSLYTPAVATCACVISASCVLATWRTRAEFCCDVSVVSSASGVLLQTTWRLSELCARSLMLVLFAMSHGYWVLLVLALHWCIMAVMRLVEWSATASFNKRRWRAFINIFVSAYIYILFYMPISNKARSSHTSVLYYSITGLENLTLLILWLIYDRILVIIHVALGSVIVCAYIACILSAMFYYQCVKGSRFSDHAEMCDSCKYRCINCRLSCCVKHDLRLQRPRVAVWIYEQAICEIIRNSRVNSLQPMPTDTTIRTSHVSVEPIEGVAAACQMDNLTCHPCRYNAKHLQTRALMQHTVQDFTWDDYDLQTDGTPELLYGSCAKSLGAIVDSAASDMELAGGCCWNRHIAAGDDAHVEQSPYLATTHCKDTDRRDSLDEFLTSLDALSICSRDSEMSFNSLKSETRNGPASDREERRRQRWQRFMDRGVDSCGAQTAPDGGAVVVTGPGTSAIEYPAVHGWYESWDDYSKC